MQVGVVEFQWQTLQTEMVSLRKKLGGILQRHYLTSRLTPSCLRTCLSTFCNLAAGNSSLVECVCPRRGCCTESQLRLGPGSLHRKHDANATHLGHEVECLSEDLRLPWCFVQMRSFLDNRLKCESFWVKQKCVSVAGSQFSPAQDWRLELFFKRFGVFASRKGSETFSRCLFNFISMLTP